MDQLQTLKALISPAYRKSKSKSSINTWRELKLSIFKRFLTKLTTKTQSTSKIWLVNTHSNCNCYNLDKSQQTRARVPKLAPPTTSFCSKVQPKACTSRSAS